MLSTPTLGKTSGIPVDDVLGFGKSVLNEYKKAQGAANQQMQMIAEKNAFIQQFGLKPPVPAKYFPECQITETKQNIPSPTDQCPIGNPMNTDFYGFVVNMADQHINELTRMKDSIKPDYSNPMASSEGLMCLKNQKEQLARQLNENAQKLENMKAQFKIINSQFKRDLEKIKNEIGANHALIYGGGRPGEDINQKNNPVGSLLKQNPVCVNLLGAQNITEFSKGLNGLKDEMYTHFVEGNNFQSNRKKLEQQIQQEVQNIQKDMTEYGINSTANTEEYVPKVLNPLPKRMGTLIQNERKTVEKELSKLKSVVGEQIFDSVYNGNVDKSSVKLNQVSDCFFGESSDGIAPTQDELLSMITQTGVNQTKVANSENCSESNKDATSALQYACDVYEFLNSSPKPSIKALKTKIGQLDQEYKGYNIALSHSKLGLNEKGETLRSYLNEIESKCSENFEKNYWPTVESAINQVNQYKKSKTTAPAKLAQKILEDVLFCRGETLSPNECNGEMFQPSSDKFCIAQANECSSKIGECYQILDNKISQIKTKMIQLATNYNTKMDSVIKAQNLNLSKVKQVFQSVGKLLEKRFPTALFKEAPDMVIPFPQIEKIFGVDLVGGGDLSYMDDIEKKIGDVQSKIDEQSKLAQKALDVYIDEERNAIDKNIKDWESIKTSCLNEHKQMQEQINKENADKQEKRKEANKVCDAYGSIISALNKDDPSGVCGSPIEELSSDLEEVRDILSENVGKDVKRISIECNLLEKSSEASNEDDTSTPNEDAFYNLCQKNSFSGKKVIKSLEEDLFSNTDPKDKDLIKRLLDGKKDDSEKGLNGKIRKAIKGIVNLKEYNNEMTKNKTSLTESNRAAGKPTLDDLGYEDPEDKNFCRDLMNQAAYKYYKKDTCTDGSSTGTCTEDDVKSEARKNFFKSYNSVVENVDSLIGINGDKFDFGEVKGGPCLYIDNDVPRSDNPYDNMLNSIDDSFNKSIESEIR